MFLFSSLFNSANKLKKYVDAINQLESSIGLFDDGALREESLKIKEAIGKSDDKEKAMNDVLPKAYALVRSAAQRALNQRHYDVQLLGSVGLHQGKVVEMMTGEGKTLASTAPAYLNALRGDGVHVVTVNEYLAKRDVVWMGQIYHLLGLSVACLAHDTAYLYDPHYKIDVEHEKSEDEKRDETASFLVREEYLRPITRKEAYQADITYGTNHEFGFDYLRDNLAPSKERQVQRGHYFAIIDEVDSVLIDEARTPLIISAPDTESSHHYKTFARIIANLQKGIHYEIDEKLRAVNITQEGIDAIEKEVGIDDLYSPEHIRLNHYINETLKAYGLFKKDKDYVVHQGQIVIIDQFTGRMMHGRRYSAGLHQALEAKERLQVQNESRTYATISIQNYFRLYKKLAGMTGTAKTSAEEFFKVYGLDVVTIPSNRPLVRIDKPDVIYKTRKAKYEALIKDVKELQEKGQPVLIGTISIENNEELSRMLSLAGITHEVLNAKSHEREGGIIAQAGRRGAVTVATNVAGRGVDIMLGGNPFDAKRYEDVKALGGLHVIGTERHEARRIDNQLRGRAGRQGDAGSSQFYLSLDDDILRVFGGERIKNLMQSLKVPEDVPISAKLINRAVEQAQGKIEGMNFDTRKHLLDYDDVVNKQRLAIYARRNELLKRKASAQELGMLDMLWMGHLENIEALMDAVRIRAYGQHDPLIEFRREARVLYQELIARFEEWKKENAMSLSAQETLSAVENIIAQPLDSVHNHQQHPDIFRSSEASREVIHAKESSKDRPSSLSRNNISSRSERSEGSYKKVGRNDPCPCGSEKKYKRCHGT